MKRKRKEKRDERKGKEKKRKGRENIWASQAAYCKAETEKGTSKYSRIG